MFSLHEGRLLAWLILIRLAFGSCCNRPSGEPSAKSFDIPRSVSKAMELYDSNQDGKISGTELDQVPGLRASLVVLGTDKDRGVTSQQIAKDDEKIPAKYNTATELGQEVSGDNPDIQKGIKFDLQY